MVFPLVTSGVVYAQTPPFGATPEIEDVSVYVEDFMHDYSFAYYSEQRLIAVFGEEFLRNHDAAIEMAETILVSFEEAEAGRIEYPKNFGGMYIDENGNLVVLAVGSEYSNEIAQFASPGNTRFVEFAYHELHEIIRVIAQFWQDDTGPVSQNIGCISLDTIGNRVEVSLSDLSAEAIELFETTVIRHPALVFIQSFGGTVLDEYFP